MSTRTAMTRTTATRHMDGLANATWQPTNRAFGAAARQVLADDPFNRDAHRALDILNDSRSGMAVLTEMNLFIDLLETVSGKRWEDSVAESEDVDSRTQRGAIRL